MSAALFPAGTLAGRDSELTLLTGLVAQLPGEHRGGAVLIEGEPGIGKSALVQAAAAAAADHGCQVFWGAGDELGQPLPLLPFLDALAVRARSANPRRNMIAGLLRGELLTDRAADVPAVLAEQLQALVADECELRPVVLVIDDLQWADEPSVALWGRLARLAGQMPLLLAGMMRPVPQRDDLLALRRAVGDEGRIRLTPLPDEAVSGLVASLAGGKPGDDLLRLAAGAAGNPLYVTELVAALDRSSSLTVTDAGIAEVTGTSVPGSLAAAIADRLGFVTRPALEALHAAALLGVEFTAAELAIVLDRGVTDLIPLLAEASAAGVLTESGASLTFRHPLIRAALYDSMPRSLRAAWHREAGRALAEAGAPPGQVARQLLRAGPEPGDPAGPMDKWMLDWLSGTADSLVTQAPAVAAGLLRWAIDSTGAADRDRLTSQLADALYRVGDPEEAEHVALRALDQPGLDPDLLVSLLWTLTQCRMRGPGAQTVLPAMDKALATPGLAPRHRARLLVLAARAHCSVGNTAEARQLAAGALELTAADDDSWAAGWALHVLTLVTAGPEVLPIFDRALAVTEADPALADLSLLLQINLAIALGTLDRYDEAFAAARRAQRRAAQVGTAIRMTQAHSGLSQLLFWTGQWDAALAEIAGIPGQIKEPGAICADSGIAAVISFHRGNTAAARRHLADGDAHIREIGRRHVSQLALAHSLDCERAGSVPDALAALTEVFAEATEGLEVEELVPDAVRLAVQARDTAAAQSLAGQAAALAAGSQIPHRLANASYCRGLLDHDGPALLTAAGHYEAARWPLSAARALEAAAAEFLTAGAREQTRAALSRAVDIYTSLGATADVPRLLARFRAQGIRLGPHSRHRRADSGWDSLTPTEAKVAELVQEGLSNPEIAARLIISTRTVATHVSHILAKLGARTRAEIAAAAARQALSPG